MMLGWDGCDQCNAAVGARRRVGALQPEADPSCIDGSERSRDVCSGQNNHEGRNTPGSITFGRPEA
jgi:hypothetical protein